MLAYIKTYDGFCRDINAGQIVHQINAAIAKFGISGKYAAGKGIKNKNGWCTKADK